MNHFESNTNTTHHLNVQRHKMNIMCLHSPRTTYNLTASATTPAIRTNRPGQETKTKIKMWMRAKKHKIKHLPDEGMKIEHITLEQERDKTGRRVRYLYGDGNHQERLGPLVDDRPQAPKATVRKTKHLLDRALKIEHATLEQEWDRTGRRVKCIYDNGNHEEKLRPIVDDRSRGLRVTKQQKTKLVAPISFWEAMRKGKPKSGPKTPPKSSMKSISQPAHLETGDKVEYAPVAMWQNALEQGPGTKVGPSGNRMVRAAPQPSKAYRVLDHPTKAMNQNLPPRPPPKAYDGASGFTTREVKTAEHEFPPTPPPKDAKYAASRPFTESTNNINRDSSQERPHKPFIEGLRRQIEGMKNPQKVTFNDLPQGKKKKSCTPTKTAVGIMQTSAETARESGNSMTSKFSHIPYLPLSLSKRASVSSDESFFCCGEPEMLQDTGAAKRSQVVNQSWLKVDRVNTLKPRHQENCWLCTEIFEGPEGLCPGCQKEYSLRLTPDREFDLRLLVPEPLLVGKVTTPGQPEIVNQPLREQSLLLILDNAQDWTGKCTSWLEDADAAIQYTEQERIRSQLGKWADIYEMDDIRRQAQQDHGVMNTGHPRISTLRENNYYTFYDDFFNEYQTNDEPEK
ncbi:hypothetical protein BGZ60DRAFT_420934 [Tricladium varicosporioides]|nr:hypothetical protein BGZ60DRAFT_420934 [Hymenoscyphus varicosporioides]